MLITREERLQVIMLSGAHSHREVAEEFKNMNPECKSITYRDVGKLATIFKETVSVAGEHRKWTFSHHYGRRNPY